jgi:aspartyl-tRNA(Asn)/glutamyl-tRNA(Gln) amidotransferase subunit A
VEPLGHEGEARSRRIESGTGVAVAAGLAPWGIGTDTGGSVRIPAAWCGLAGLKTTIGRISVHGVLPLAHTLDTPGPMCRSVEDAALLYNLLQGPDPLDPLTLRHAPDDPMPDLKRGVAGLVLAAYRQATAASSKAKCSPPTAPAARAPRTWAQTRGREPAAQFRPAGIDGRAHHRCEGYSCVGELWTMPRCPSIPTCGRFAVGKGVSARDYLLLRAARATQARLVRRWRCDAACADDPHRRATRCRYRPVGTAAVSRGQ